MSDEQRLIGRAISPPEITGQESLWQLIETTFSFGVARQFRQFMASLKLAIEQDHVLVWTFNGILTPSRMSVSCVNPLIEAGLVDIMATTNAAAYHDIGAWHQTRTARRPDQGTRPDTFEVDPNGNDETYRQAKIIRVYDLGFDETEGLLRTDEIAQQLISQTTAGSPPLSTAELLWRMGDRMGDIEHAAGHDVTTSPSLLVRTALAGIPIFNDAFWNGSIGMNLARLWLSRTAGSQPVIDYDRDVNAYAGLMHHVIGSLNRPMTIVIIGGGGPKNYSLQTGPHLTQVCELDERFCYATELQICDAPADNGSLSSAPATEAYTWGKVTTASLPRNQYVRADWAPLLPLITHMLLHEGYRREPTRLIDAIPTALAGLAEAVAAQERSAPGRDPGTD